MQSGRNLQSLSTAVISKVGCTAPWGALEVSPSECAVCLFMLEVTLDQKLGNWYHFIKPIHHIKNLLTVSLLLGITEFLVFVGRLVF